METSFADIAGNPELSTECIAYKSVEKGRKRNKTVPSGKDICVTLSIILLFGINAYLLYKTNASEVGNRGEFKGKVRMYTNIFIYLKIPK